MTAVTTRKLSGTSVAAIRPALADLLDAHRTALGTGDRVLLVPDTHYPYHPSTGMVTNPDVVEALATIVDGDVAVGIPSSAHVDADRVGRFLGYERLAERTGAALVDLDDAERVEEDVSLASGDVPLSVPRPLVDDAVVVVPTARRSARYGVAAGMVALAHAVAEDPTRETVLAASRACWPALGVLDATFVYDGEPRRADRLAASEDLVALSQAAADLVGVDPDDVPHLRSRRAPPSPLPSFGGGQPDDGDGAKERAYRLYARVSGDLVPPQMLARGEHE